MAYNFNNYAQEYKLFNSQTDEIINLYGLECKYIKTKGQNLDLIFGEYSHKQLTQAGVKKFYVLPESNENFDQVGGVFSKFGFTNTETFNFFLSANNAEKLNYTDLRAEAVGDILVLPNGKKFEVTYVDIEVPGTNNMFPYLNNKNVFLFRAKMWFYNSDKKEEVLPNSEDNLSEFNFTELDSIFTNDDTTVPSTPEKPVKERLRKQDKEAEKIKLDSKDVFGEWG